ncbi:MAG: hypothetical protein ACK41E_01200 [Deinococcales bacterium]
MKLLAALCAVTTSQGKHRSEFTPAFHGVPRVEPRTSNGSLA